MQERGSAETHGSFIEEILGGSSCFLCFQSRRTNSSFRTPDARPVMSQPQHSIPCPPLAIIQNQHYRKHMPSDVDLREHGDHLSAHTNSRERPHILLRQAKPTSLSYSHLDHPYSMQQLIAEKNAPFCELGMDSRPVLGVYPDARLFSSPGISPGAAIEIARRGRTPIATDFYDEALGAWRSAASPLAPEYAPPCAGPIDPPAPASLPVAVRGPPSPSPPHLAAIRPVAAVAPYIPLRSLPTLQPLDGGDAAPGL